MMFCSVDLRERAVGYARGSGGLAEAALRTHQSPLCPHKMFVLF